MPVTIGARTASLALVFLAPTTAFAQGIAARLVDTWATRGEPVIVEAEIDDPIAVVDRVVFELAVDGRVRTATVTSPPWVAVFPAASVWPFGPERLELSAKLLGRRGGILLGLGVPFRKDLEILNPAESTQRRRDFARATQPEDAFPVGVVVAAEGRFGSAARARAHVAILGPVSRRVELKLGLSTGPSFAEPAAQSGGGPLVLGTELGARVTATRSTFVDALATADVRFPGFDPGGALFVGVRGPWAGVGWEIAAGGGALAANADAGAEAVFFGAVRAGVRFGSTGSEVSETTGP